MFVLVPRVPVGLSLELAGLAKLNVVNVVSEGQLECFDFIVQETSLLVPALMVNVDGGQ